MTFSTSKATQDLASPEGIQTCGWPFLSLPGRHRCLVPWTILCCIWVTAMSVVTGGWRLQKLSGLVSTVKLERHAVSRTESSGWRGRFVTHTRPAEWSRGSGSRQVSSCPSRWYWCNADNIYEWCKKKKKNLCTILLQCRCKTILVSGQIFAQFSFGKTILSIRLRSWSKGPRDLWSSCCGRIVPLTERIRGAQLLWVQAQHLLWNPPITVKSILRCRPDPWAKWSTPNRTLEPLAYQETQRLAWIP